MKFTPLLFVHKDKSYVELLFILLSLFSVEKEAGNDCFWRGRRWRDGRCAGSAHKGAPSNNLWKITIL